MKKIYIENKEIIPSKIVCVGRNYVEHIKELGNEIPENMVLFMKPNSAISDELCSGAIEPIHFEGEISVEGFLVELDGAEVIGCPEGIFYF